MILGRPALMRLRVSESGEVVQLTRDQMHALIQTDAEMSDVLMKALIYRRIELVAQGIGDVLLIGSAHSAATLRIKAFLTRNGHPFKYLDLDRDADVRDLLDRFHVDPAELPVVICRGEAVLKNPSNQEIADCLGFNGRIDQAHLRDVVIVGAGPAGLAAAVYAASEGLDALVIEASSPGGQAGSSSRIENYLGFPTGISGQELAGRAYAQAQKFGAEVMIAKGAAELICERQPYGVRLDDGATIPARTVIIATGARYRKPSLANLASVRRCRRLLQRDLHGGSAARRRRRGHRRRRRQLGRSGRGISGADRETGSCARPIRTVFRRACRDTCFAASKRPRRSRSEREPRSWLSRETGIWNVCSGATAQAPSRVTTSSTCS